MIILSGCRVQGGGRPRFITDPVRSRRRLSFTTPRNRRRFKKCSTHFIRVNHLSPLRIRPLRLLIGSLERAEGIYGEGGREGQGKKERSREGNIVLAPQNAMKAPLHKALISCVTCLSAADLRRNPKVHTRSYFVSSKVNAPRRSRILRGSLSFPSFKAAHAKQQQHEEQTQI